MALDILDLSVLRQSGLSDFHSHDSNILIFWSVIATDKGISLSRPVLATDHPPSFQEWASNQAKARGTLNPLASSLHEKVKRFDQNEDSCCQISSYDGDDGSV